MIKNRAILAMSLTWVLGEKLLMAMSLPPSIQWSVDGGTMAIISNAGVQTFDASGNPLKSSPLDANAHEILLSPDGMKVAYILQGRQIWILDIASGSKIQIFAISGSMQVCSALKWSISGQSLTFSVFNAGANQGQIYIIRPDGSGKISLYTFSL